MTFENQEVLGVEFFEIILSSIVDFLDTFQENDWKMDFLGGFGAGCIKPFFPRMA